MTRIQHTPVANQPDGLPKAEEETAGPSTTLPRFCFVSGPDFSRAVKGKEELGFSPCYGAS